MSSTTTMNATPAPAKSTFKKLVAKAKEHHESMNAAYATYYSGGRYVSHNAGASLEPRASSDSVNSKSNASKAWSSLKKAAREHHESLNQAYASYYGAGMSTPPSAASSTTTSNRSSVESLRK